jgi:hypothetical protein
VAHVLHESGESVLALTLALKLPWAQTRHTRSLLTVAAVLVNVPAAHLALTTEHAASLLDAENDVPASQAAHWRLAVAEPSTDLPWPAGHVAQAVQVSVIRVPALMLDLKVPDAQASHSRSLLTVAPLVVKVPGPHGALTTVHASPLFAGENVEPTTHPAHLRLAVAEPATDMPWPVQQVRQVAHTSLPAAALNMPAGHTEHTRLDVSVGAVVSYSPAAHVVMSWHTRSEVVVAAVKMNWCASHVVCVLQSRSLLSVGAACSYSVPVHVVTATQAAPLSMSEYVRAAVTPD